MRELCFRLLVYTGTKYETGHFVLQQIFKEIIMSSNDHPHLGFILGVAA